MSSAPPPQSPKRPFTWGNEIQGPPEVSFSGPFFADLTQMCLTSLNDGKMPSYNRVKHFLSDKYGEEEFSRVKDEVQHWMMQFAATRKKSPLKQNQGDSEDRSDSALSDNNSGSLASASIARRRKSRSQSSESNKHVKSFVTVFVEPVYHKGHAHKVCVRQDIQDEKWCCNVCYASHKPDDMRWHCVKKCDWDVCFKCMSVFRGARKEVKLVLSAAAPLGIIMTKVASVVGVRKDSCADRARLNILPGDYLLAVNGVTVESASHFAGYVRELQDGAQLRLEFVEPYPPRDRKRHVVTMGDRKATSPSPTAGAEESADERTSGGVAWTPAQRSLEIELLQQTMMGLSSRDPDEAQLKAHIKDKIRALRRHDRPFATVGTDPGSDSDALSPSALSDSDIDGLERSRSLLRHQQQLSKNAKDVEQQSSQSVPAARHHSQLQSLAQHDPGPGSTERTNAMLRNPRGKEHTTMSSRGNIQEASEHMSAGSTGDDSSAAVAIGEARTSPTTQRVTPGTPAATSRRKSNSELSNLVSDAKSLAQSVREAALHTSAMRGGDGGDLGSCRRCLSRGVSKSIGVGTEAPAVRHMACQTEPGTSTAQPGLLPHELTEALHHPTDDTLAQKEQEIKTAYKLLTRTNKQLDAAERKATEATSVNAELRREIAALKVAMETVQGDATRQSLAVDTLQSEKQELIDDVARAQRETEQLKLRVQVLLGQESAEHETASSHTS
eukprot:m.638072 g.638072  ORF g.638072 m.638072 type:complete len:726 (+) comp22603_c0_seq1:168-2345(+)